MNLLKSLLASLIAEWGPETVRETLEKLVADSDDARTQRSGRGVAGDGRRARAPKPTAAEIVSRMDVAPARQKSLERLAAQYDAKQFLPTAADIRLFFEDQSLAPPVVKHRSDVFRKIASVLQQMPQESLEALLTNRAYAGPSQLGPLSNAMRRSGDSMRRSTSDRLTSNEPDETGEHSTDTADGKEEDQ